MEQENLEKKLRPTMRKILEEFNSAINASTRDSDSLWYEALRLCSANLKDKRGREYYDKYHTFELPNHCTDVQYTETKDYKVAIIRFNDIPEFRHSLDFFLDSPLVPRDVSLWRGAYNHILFTSKDRPDRTAKVGTEMVPMYDYDKKGQPPSKPVDELTHYLVKRDCMKEHYSQLKENEPVLKGKFLKVETVGDNKISISWVNAEGKEYESSKRIVNLDDWYPGKLTRK